MKRLVTEFMLAITLVVKKDGNKSKFHKEKEQKRNYSMFTYFFFYYEKWHKMLPEQISRLNWAVAGITANSACNTSEPQKCHPI